MENQYYNYNWQFQQNNMNTDQNPYSLDNLYFNKSKFREFLMNMKEEQRKAFIETLPKDFVNSFRMPSLKSKITLMVLSAFLGLFGIDRFYRNKIVSGLLKVFASIIAIVATALLILTVHELWTEVTWKVISSIILLVVSEIAVYVWVTFDIIMAVLGKSKDKDNRKIDL